MGEIHFIETEKTLDVLQFNEALLKSISEIQITQYEKFRFNYIVKNKSNRGVDLIFQNRIIRIKNLIYSNEFDFNLTNTLIEIMSSLTELLVYDDVRDVPFNLPIYDTKNILKLDEEDREYIYSFKNIVRKLLHFFSINLKCNSYLKEFSVII